MLETAEVSKNKKLAAIKNDLKKILKDKENIEYKILSVLE